MCPNGYNMENQTIAEYVKQMRRETGLTQVDLSEIRFCTCVETVDNVILVTFPEESAPEALFPFVIFL